VYGLGPAIGNNIDVDSDGRAADSYNRSLEPHDIAHEHRFLELDPEIFARLIAIFWDPRGFEVFPTVREGIQEALRLLASRVAGRGSFPGVRQRSTTRGVEESPFYRLIFATEKFIEPPTTEALGAPANIARLNMGAMR